MMEDGFFWINRTNIQIPGVKGEHLIMHITDTHLNVSDELSSEEDREKTAKQEEMWVTFKEKFAQANGEPYGDAQRISTREAFEKLLALAQELKPEALLLAGDNLEYTYPAGQRYLEKRLGEYGGKYLCVPGNHEADACGSLWSPGVRTLEFDGFRIAAVDNSQKTVSRSDLDTLHALCEEGIPMIILCHIPMETPHCRADCTEKLFGMDDYFYLHSNTEDENAREFISLCETNDTVKAVLCGHVHGYHAMELAPGKPQIVGSMGMTGAVDLVTVGSIE